MRGPEFPTDHERPLAPRGMRDAPRIAELLRAEKLLPDLIIASTAVRAVDTAQLVQRELDGVELETNDLLYAASLDDLLDVMHELPDASRCVLLVGHNPGLEELVCELTAETEVVLKTCSLAVVRLHAPTWHAAEHGNGELVAVYHIGELEA